MQATPEGPHSEASAAEIASAVSAIAAGEAIGLPTETVYGLAADGASRDAVGRIYRIKGRPDDHPLIVHVLDATQARRWAQWNDAAQRLVDAFWPGPLSIVLERRPDAPGWACAGQSTIALRSPSHPVARRVMAALLEVGITGLAAPSANRFGRVSPTRAAHVHADLGDDVAIVLEGGSAEVGIESTIVDLSRGRPVLLRPGHIGVNRLAEVLGEPVGAADAEAPRVPGALPSHYAPVTPLVLVEASDLKARIAREVAGGRRIAVWSFESPSIDEPVAPVGMVQWHRLPDSAEATERVLYADLRAIDSAGFDLIVVEAPPESAQWLAISDRLTRAAAR